MFKTSNMVAILALSALVASTIVAQNEPSSDQRALTDDAIRDGLAELLKFDDVLRRRDITADVKEGVALLTGKVSSLFEKERAVATAETIRGVRAVVDQIEIEQQDRADVEVQADVMAALAADPVTAIAELQVGVDQGRVTLNGTADSHVQKLLCLQVAKSVRGVRQVTCELKIQHRGNRSDDELRTEIIRRLQSDVWVTGDLVRVDVKDGEVSLSGVVGSAAEKHVAEVDALIPGVKDVDSSNLDINSAAAHDVRRQRKYAVPRPGQTSDAVRDALRHDPRVNADDIAVHLEAGVIQLRGQVNTLAARRAAEQDALRTRFVARVDNQLVVAATSKEYEAEAAAMVLAALKRDIYVSEDNISVAVDNGIARLSGTINSKTGKQRAESIAEGVTGITAVENGLKVTNDAAPPTDLQIKYGIKNRLYWSSLIDDSNITVQAEGGRVVLSGSVDDRAGFNFATQAANEAGAKEVDNRLLIREQDFE